MGIKRVVSDFDGTVTVEKELEPFFQAYRTVFCEAVGLGLDVYGPAIARVRRDMAAEPLEFGWRSNGFFSAPVTGDPIGSNTVAHVTLLRRIQKGDVYCKKPPGSEDEVIEVRELCYDAAYSERKTHFREGAAPYLNRLAEMFPGAAAIMSNSRATSIARKLKGLEGLTAELPLIGLAQKMEVNSDEGAFQPEGFPVPVHPDRPEYLSRLRVFCPDLSQLAVIGDNFFLDLATILHHGGWGILLETEATQGYEVPFLEQHPRGYVAENYDDALEFLSEH